MNAPFPFSASNANVTPVGQVNRLNNGDFNFFPEGANTVGSGTTVFVNWRLLTQAGSASTSQIFYPENGQYACARITQSNATAQRFGLQQTVTAQNCGDLRTAFVSLSGRLRFSNAAAVRFALLEWKGTPDASPANVVNDWTSGAYVSGQFFASSVSVIAEGAAVGPAGQWQSIPYVPFQCSPLLSNLILFVWTQDPVAQNGTLDYGLLQINEGSSQLPFAHNSSVLYSGAIYSIGPNAGFYFTDRTTDRQWSLYGSGDYVYFNNGVDNTPFRLHQDGGLRISGSAVYVDLNDIAATYNLGLTRTVPLISTSKYFDFPAGGQAIYLNTSAGLDFASSIDIGQWWTNPDRTSTDGPLGRFPNGTTPLGDDGAIQLNLNDVSITSTSGLLLGRQSISVASVGGGGAITGLTIGSPLVGGYTPGTGGIRTGAFCANNPSAAGLVVTWTVNGSGNIASYVINNGGSGFDVASTSISIDPPPGTTALDIGPQLNLGRDVLCGAGSFLGGITFQGRFTGASLINAVYGQFGIQVLDPSPTTGLSHLLFQTIINGAQHLVWRMRSTLYSESVTGVGVANESVDIGGSYYVADVQVVGPRKTGWGLPTGTLTRTALNTGTATTAQVAQALGALITDLYGGTGPHGLIGT